MDATTLDRRDFLTRTATLSALAVLAGACGGDAGSLTAPVLDAPLTVKLSDYPDLAQVGVAVRLTGVGIPIALVNLGDGSYLALSLTCTHQGATVQTSANGFRCPNHGALFAPDGTWTGGQPTSSLRRYPTSYDAQAGTVLVSPG